VKKTSSATAAPAPQETTPETPPEKPKKSPRSPLESDMLRHIVSSLGSDYERTGAVNYYMGLSLAVRDRLIDKWIMTQRAFYEGQVKRVYYLSMEFLPGPFLVNNLLNMEMEETGEAALRNRGLTLDEVAGEEFDPGLGNGGLGRLASCYLDSMASLRIPGYGYGIRYAFGIFHQAIENGYQIEHADNWLRLGNTWGFDRPQNLYPVHFYGRVLEWTDEQGRLRHLWADTTKVMAMACDYLIPGYGNGYVTNMRLWVARTSREFNLGFFNTGDYVGAVEDKIRSENISMVLYPNDETMAGKELRLRQQYFFVSATLQDITRRYKKKNETWDDFPNQIAIHLNETHPAIAIPELMRQFVDIELLPWEIAWDICTRTFAYTNHTVLPEALEHWPEELVERMLPRHMQIIHEINRRFLDDVRRRYPQDPERVPRMSIVDGGDCRQVRMAHLAIVGSHTVNGVSALHSEILKARVFKDFHELYPERFTNITNGITPRRWLLQCNKNLAGLITEKIGADWITQLDKLKELIPLAGDADFRQRWIEVKRQNKLRLASLIEQSLKIKVPVEGMFDVQVKRFHEYKRQLLNILGVVALYNRIKDNPDAPTPPRVVIFGGKAAPGYRMAKMIIKLIHSVAYVVNTDPVLAGRLKVVFLPNYSVSLAEKIIPAADLSEQISTAGMEASGTGNMKFALNGALTIGTYDGANIEIMEEVGAGNIFLFGLKEEQIEEIKARGYNPREYYESDPELHRALDMIANGYFSPAEPVLYRGIIESLLDMGDRFMVLADFAAYQKAREAADKLFAKPHEWAKRSILNTANMGKFSSDRALMEYAKRIWNVTPLD